MYKRQLLEEQVFPPGGSDPLERITEEGDRLDTRVPSAIRALVSERLTVVDSARFSIQADTPDPSFLRFRIQPGASERIHYVAGGAPAARREQVQMPDELRRFLPPAETSSTDPVAVTVLETAISVEAAEEIDKTVGDLLFLTFDGRDPLAQSSPGVVATRIVGIFEMNDAADPFWYEDQTLNHVLIRSIGGDTRFVDVGALLPADSYEALIKAGQFVGTPIRVTWRHFVDPARVASAQLEPLLVDLRRLESAFPQTPVTSGTPIRGGGDRRAGVRAAPTRPVPDRRSGAT